MLGFPRPVAFTWIDENSLSQPVPCLGSVCLTYKKPPPVLPITSLPTYGSMWTWTGSDST